MLPARRGERALRQRLRNGVGVGTVLHYAVCALAISIGLFGFISSALAVVFDVQVGLSAGWTIVYWVTLGGILLWELLYRPPRSVTSALGFGSMLLLCSWLATAILVSFLS